MESPDKKTEIKINTGNPAPTNPLEAIGNGGAAPTPEAAKPTPPAPPIAPAAPAPPPTTTEANKPADLSFFDKEKKKDDQGGFAKDIVKLTTDTKQKKPILGDVPKLDAAIIGQSFMMKRRLKMLYGVFAAILLLFAVSFGFFYTQLSPDFTMLGANPVQRIDSTNQEIIAVQTDVNESMYLTAQMRLNAFAFRSNQYQDFIAQLESPRTPEPAKQSLQTQIAELREQLLADVSELQKILKRKITAPTFDRDQLQFVENPVDMETRTRTKLSIREGEEAGLYKAAADLVGNKALTQAIANADVNALTQEPAQLDTLIKTVNEQVKNEFSIVNTLKAKRVNWHELLTDIINSTKQAEEGLIVANEGLLQMNLYQAGGTAAILYSNYTLNAANAVVSISGTLKTPDEKTFTTMANLIESISASSKFTDVNYRSFAKSGSDEEGYESNFRIEFAIQEELIADEDFTNTDNN